MAHYASLMAPLIGKKAAIRDMEPDGGEGYWCRNYYLGRLVAVKWEDGRKMPTLEFDRNHRYYGKYYTPSSDDLENFRFKSDDAEEDLAEDGDAGFKDWSYDIPFSQIYELYKRAKRRERKEIKRRQQRYTELLEKILDKDVRDGTIQLRQGEIQVSKKFLGIVSPVFKEKFADADAKTNVIQVTDHEPADVELFIQLLTGNELPPSGVSKLANLVELFDAFQAGSILKFVPDFHKLISKDAAREKYEASCCRCRSVRDCQRHLWIQAE